MGCLRTHSNMSQCSLFALQSISNTEQLDQLAKGLPHSRLIVVGCREDVQCMTYAAPYMLATGDYSGRICVWNIFPGERRWTLTHEAPEYQRGIEQLLFLHSPDSQVPTILLSCGGMPLVLIKAFCTIHNPSQVMNHEPQSQHARCCQAS